MRLHCNFTQLYQSFLNGYSALLATSNGVWLGGGGLELYGSGTVSSPGGQFPGYCRDLAIESSGSLWMATLNGIAKYDGTFWSIYNTTNSTLPTNQFTSIAIDSSDNIWATTTNYGLFRFDGTNWINFDTSNTIFPTNETNYITFDRNGLLWVSVHRPYPSGQIDVFRYDGMNWSQINFPTCLNLGSISRAYFDSQNNAWFSNSNNFPERPTPFGYGLVKFDGSSVEIWSDSLLAGYNHRKYDMSCNILVQDSASKIPGPGVFSLFVDHYDRVWGGVSEADEGEGLFVLDGGNFTVFNSTNSQLGANAIGDFSEHGDSIYFITNFNSVISDFRYLKVYSCGSFTNIFETNNINSFDIYPNPTKGDFSINVPGSKSPGNIIIMDISGKVVYEENETFSVRNLSLPDGFYLCTYETGEHIITKKLIVQN